MPGDVGSATLRSIEESAMAHVRQTVRPMSGVIVKQVTREADASRDLPEVMAR
jgi:hypothetical protein